MTSRKQPTTGAIVLTAGRNRSRFADSAAPVPASEVLKAMLEILPEDHFTLGWLSSHLQRRSFGVIVLVLALVAMVPGISYLGGFLLLAPAIEMMLGHDAPMFPGRIANRPLPTRYLDYAVQRAVPALKRLERVIRPRWQMPLGATKRLVGIAVFWLTLLLLLTPLPFIQILPGVIIIVLSVAYLEDDGLLLSLGLLATLILAGASAGAIWGMIVALS